MVLTRGCIFQLMRLTAKSGHRCGCHSGYLWAFPQSIIYSLFPTLTEGARKQAVTPCWPPGFSGYSGWSHMQMTVCDVSGTVSFPMFSRDWQLSQMPSPSHQTQEAATGPTAHFARGSRTKAAHWVKALLRNPSVSGEAWCFCIQP